VSEQFLHGTSALMHKLQSAQNSLTRVVLPNIYIEQDLDIC